jgi:hypothetical protein
MYRPPSDHRHHHHHRVTEPTWRGVLVSYLSVASIPLVLWMVSQPAAGAVLLAVVAGLAAGTRRGLWLVHCLAECGGFSFDIGEQVRITVTRPGIDESC